MVQEVLSVADASHGKFWVRYSCGHCVLYDKDRNNRGLYWEGLVTDCEFCLSFDGIEVGDELELELVYCNVPQIAKFMGYVADGRLRFIFAEGEDSLICREIVKYRKIY